MNPDKQSFCHDDLVMMLVWNVLLTLTSFDGRVQEGDGVIAVYFLVINGMYLAKISLEAFWKFSRFCYEKRNRIRRESRRVKASFKAFKLNQRAFLVCLKWLTAFVALWAFLLLSVGREGFGYLWVPLILLSFLYVIGLFDIYRREIEEENRKNNKGD